MGFVSDKNSSNVIIANGQTFTGVNEDTLGYGSTIVAVKTDQDGTLYVDFSTDGTNYDSTLSFNVTASTNEVHRITNTRRWMRVRFTNSGGTQTYFRLQSTVTDAVALNQSINSPIQQDADSASTRPTDFHYEVALSRRQGHTTWNKFGYNGDLDIGTEMIWAYGGLFTRLNTASTFTVVSSSAQDILTSGTGAWNVVIYYVDADRVAQTVVVPLNGTTPVVTAVSGLGINRVALYNTGSGDTNAGNITITATTGGSVQAYIPTGEGTTQQAIFFTQDNHTALCDWLFVNVNRISGGSSPRITIKGWVYSYVSTAKYLVFYDVIDTAVENHLELKPSQPFVIGEKSILWFEATSDTNNATVGCRFSLIEVKDF